MSDSPCETGQSTLLPTDVAHRCNCISSAAGPSSAPQQRNMTSTCWAVLVSVCMLSSGGDAGGFPTQELPAVWHIAPPCTTVAPVCTGPAFRGVMPGSAGCATLRRRCLYESTTEKHTPSWVATTGCSSTYHWHTTPGTRRDRPRRREDVPQILESNVSAVGLRVV